MIMRLHLPLFVSMLSLVVMPALAQDAEEETRPLWEAGIGGGAIYAPDYPGSDEYHVNGIAFPYVVYRGDVFRLGDGSIAKGVFVETGRIEFDISLDASFDAESDDNNARRGMPDLDFLGEIGPQIVVTLDEHKNDKWQVTLPVRAVFSTDFSNLNHRGYVFNPRLSYEREEFFERLNLFVGLGVSFATRKLQNYFYRVEPGFATPSRAAFDAKGGYMGSELTVGFSYKMTDRVRVFTGGQVSYLGGAANKDSPLFRTDLTGAFGGGFVWSLYESDARAGSR